MHNDTISKGVIAADVKTPPFESITIKSNFIIKCAKDISCEINEYLNKSIKKKYYFHLKWGNHLKHHLRLNLIVGCFYITHISLVLIDKNNKKWLKIDAELVV